MQRAGQSTPRAALHYQHAADDAQRRIADRLDAAMTARTRPGCDRVSTLVITRSIRLSREWRWMSPIR